MSRNATYEDCEVRIDTPQALLIYIPDLDQEQWFPRSVLSDDCELDEQGDTGDLIVADWFCKQEGLT